MDALGRAAAYIGALSLYTALAGLYFDIAYHHLFPFEAFWSNPHILMYSGLALAFIIGFILVIHPGLRRGFGGKTVKVMGMEISPYSALYALACLTALLAGYLDSIWHGIWGSFESAYSFPHTLALTSSYTAALILIHVLNRHYNSSVVATSLLLAGVGMAFFRTFVGPLSNSKEFFLELASGEGMGEHFHGASALLWIKYVEKGVYAENGFLSTFFTSLVFLTILYLSWLYTSNRLAPFATAIGVAALLQLFHIIVDMAGYNPVYRSPVSLSVLLMGVTLYLLPNYKGLILSMLYPGIIHIITYGFTPTSFIGGLIGGGLAILYATSIHRGLEMRDIGWLSILLSTNLLLIPALLGYLDMYIRFM